MSEGPPPPNSKLHRPSKLIDNPTHLTSPTNPISSTNPTNFHQPTTLQAVLLTAQEELEDANEALARAKRSYDPTAVEAAEMRVGEAGKRVKAAGTDAQLALCPNYWILKPVRHHVRGNVCIVCFTFACASQLLSLYTLYTPDTPLCKTFTYVIILTFNYLQLDRHSPGGPVPRSWYFDDQ